MIEIVTDINKLREVSTEVLDTDPVDEWVRQLTIALDEHHGAGLAAIQIGIPKRLFVYKEYMYKPLEGIDTMKTRDSMQCYIQSIINPKIVNAYDPFIFGGESCLSFPGKFISTKRFREVMVTDNEHPGGRVFEHILSIIMQHEIGHFDGKVLFDYEYKSNPIGRNDKCPCNSGRKYKHCCGK